MWISVALSFVDLENIGVCFIYLRVFETSTYPLEQICIEIAQGPGVQDKLKYSLGK